MKKFIGIVFLMSSLLNQKAQSQTYGNSRFNCNGAIGTYNTGKKDFANAVPAYFDVIEEQTNHGSSYLDFYYIGKKRLGGGFRYTNSSYEYVTAESIGTVGFNGYLLLITTMFGLGEGHYWDVASIESDQKDYGVYAVYRLTKTERKKVHMEVATRGGINYHTLEETQNIAAGKMYNNNQTYYGSKQSISQNENGVSLMLNMSFNLHVGKHISILLADFTENIGIVNPEFNGTSLSYDTKTVEIESHKIHLTSFRYGFGLGLHF